MSSNKIKDCQLLLEQYQSGRKFNYRPCSILIESQLKSIVRDDIIPKFWSHFSPESSESEESYKALLDAIEFLYTCCGNFEKILNANHQTLKAKFFIILKSQILSQRPHYLSKYLDATYAKGIKTFLTLEKARNQEAGAGIGGEDEVEMEEEEELFDDGGEQDDLSFKQNHCWGCKCTRECCDCSRIYEKFCKMNEYLRDFDLLEGLVGDTVMNVARILIELRVSAKCKLDYSCSYLNQLTSWVHNIVKNWIQKIYGLNGTESINDIGQKLDQFLNNAYAEVRVAHMFEIIIEYPNSEAAIQDLKTYLEQSTTSDFRLNLIHSVKQSLTESLLHPGVNTYDILTAYISAIKALRALDPSGLILQLVTEPVRRYLKSRDDTVRCIVTALTDEDHNSELNREMIRSSSQTNENGVDVKSGTTEMIIPGEGEKCTASNFEKWKPDPIKLNSSEESMKSNRFSDIVSILVNIYETKDLFVEEYQKLLSQRLLNKYDECNLDTELRNLELLTIRFSDCELHRCEVMLKDVQTSKRINKRILSEDIREHKLDKFKNLDVLIVSSPFWPDKFSPMASLSDEPPEIRFPPEIESAMSTYTKAFEAIQASRTLHWRHHLGSVNLDLTIAGKTQNFTVSPLHASILYLFKEKKSWRLSEIMHKTSLPAATIRSRLALWQRNGIIRDCGEDKYDLIVE